MKTNYRKTLTACYLGFITQAIAANFTPLLYLKFHKDYSIPLGRIALISLALFLTQLIVDILCAKFADRIGYRKSVVASGICSSVGLALLAFLPDMLPDPFVGILLSVILYSIGSGLIEVLCSPIVEACPFDRKEAVMSLLHSFYCWGSVAVIALSTAFFTLFGIGSWKILVLIWAAVPLYNVYNFATCPIEHLVKDGAGMSILALCKTPVFFAGVILMVCAGASELSMAQWASAYAEAAIGLSKTAGDLLGPCMFAVTMGLCRLLFGKYGDRLNLLHFMAGSGGLCLLCYILASSSKNPMLGLAGCIICGFSVGIMWPGTISILSKTLPSGGTAMFALLAMAGDLGGALGPWLVGNISQNSGDNMQRGMLAGCIFPVMLILSLAFISRSQKEKTT